MPATLKVTHKAIGAEVRRGAYDVVVDGVGNDDRGRFSERPTRRSLTSRRLPALPRRRSGSCSTDSAKRIRSTWPVVPIIPNLPPASPVMS